MPNGGRTFGPAPFAAAPPPQPERNPREVAAPSMPPSQ
jgi:hypothetical protein